MDAEDIQQYLYAHIPLSRAMALSVAAASTESVRLTAPLAPNINHRETAFGGSVSALAILSAWTLLYVRMQGAGVAARLVIQKSTVHYDAPITGAFSAEATLRDAGDWDRFVQTLGRRNRARITVLSILTSGNAKVGTFEGDFVALTA